MARGVNVSLGAITTTGTNVTVAQRSVSITFSWIDNVGVSHTDTRTALFPNILSNLTASEQDDLILSVAMILQRRAAGVDS